MNFDTASAATRTLGQEEKAEFAHFGPCLHFKSHPHGTRIVWRGQLIVPCSIYSKLITL